MSLPLVPVSIAAPGFKGINRSASAIDLEPSWALDATNCVLDKTGRIASRKGWLPVTTAPIAGTPVIESIGEYLTITGTTQFISAANNIIYSGSTTLTNIYSTAITANRWQMVNFNNFLWLFQRNHVPLRWNGAAMVTIASLGGTGTAPSANSVIGAYGRLWAIDTVTDKTILYFSDTLIGQNWTGGAAGTLDLKSVWTAGMDEGTAVAAFNGFLIIFGKKSILVYSGPTNPASMTLVEHVKGIGCIARDSIQDIGTDLLFLSDTGVRSLARTIQEKSMPLRDLTVNVRDDVISMILQQALLMDDVRSVYHEPEGFYLLHFPSVDVTFCLDIRRVLENGGSPVTYWNHINPRAFLSSRDRELYLGKSGVIGKHTGYLDNTETYDMNYLTAWISFQEPFIQKILKKIIYTVVGANNTAFVVKWAYDYLNNYFSQIQTISGGQVSEYNIAEYNIAEYSSGISIDEITTPGSSAGKMIQFGLFAQVNGSQLALQKMDIYAKRGRML